MYLESERIVFTARVGEQGRVTIPKIERDRHNIKQGDLVDIQIRKVEESRGK